MNKRRRCIPIGNNRVMSPQTNLSLSITGADEANEGVNTVYNMVLTMAGLIGAADTQVVITLPAGISYIGSSDGVNSGQTITWTIGDLVGNYVRAFTIVSSTQATYTITGVLTTSTDNSGTTTASKEIEVIEPPSGPIVGCMNPASNTYNPEATQHDPAMCFFDEEE